MEVGTAFTLFDKLLDVLGLVKSGKIERDNRVDEALNSLHEALVETQAYVRISAAQGRNTEKEHNLSHLWHRASVPMRHIDREVSQICGLKGAYWSNPDVWEEIRSGNLDISLSNVEGLAFELLAK